MTAIRIRDGEADRDSPWLLPDTVWQQATHSGDWALKGGGLQAEKALETAVILALFTDRRCPSDHPLARFADDDPRGWWGDGVDVRSDLGEGDLGSLLWLLERSVVTAETARWAESLAAEALVPLVSQGAVARIAVTVEAQPERNRLDLLVQLYDRFGGQVYDRKFDLLWQQVG